jgi:hypothetical protein
LDELLAARLDGRVADEVGERVLLADLVLTRLKVSEP